MHILCMENRIFQLELTKENTTEKEKEGGGGGKRGKKDLYRESHQKVVSLICNRQVPNLRWQVLQAGVWHV